MKTNRRRALQVLAVLPAAVSAAAADGDDKKATAPTSSFVGSWYVTVGVTSFILSIEPQAEALYLRIESGAFNISRVKWKAMAGGLFLQCLPRLRLWPGRDANEIRVEREDFPRDDVSDSFKQFPLAFFMRRAVVGKLMPMFADRPLPEGWDRAELPADWDQRAGKWNK